MSDRTKKKLFFFPHHEEKRNMPLQDNEVRCAFWDNNGQCVQPEMNETGFCKEHLLNEKKKCTCEPSTEITTPCAKTSFEMYPGLSLPRYQAGDNVRPHITLLHRKCYGLSGINQDKIQYMVSKAIETAPVARRSVPQWEHAVWAGEIVVCGPPRAADSKVNFFYHGWLWPQGPTGTSGLSFPLIGVLSPSPLFQYIVPGKETDLAEETLRFSEHHYHQVDPWAGASKEDYIQLLMEEQKMSSEEAEELADVESVVAGDYFIGADVAKMQLNPKHAKGTVTAVCVDIRDSRQPKVLISEVYMIMQENAQKEFTKYFGTRPNPTRREITTFYHNLK